MPHLYLTADLHVPAFVCVQCLLPARFCFVPLALLLPPCNTSHHRHLVLRNHTRFDRSVRRSDLRIASSRWSRTWCLRRTIPCISPPLLRFPPRRSAECRAR